MKVTITSDPRVIAVLNEPVQNLHHKLYPEIFKPYDLQKVCDYFEDLVNKENHYFVVCEENDVALGYIWFEEVQRAETAFSRSKHYIYIHQISVNEEHRGKGIGKLLFNPVSELAEKQKIKRIGLDYWVKNNSAKLIYEKLGFELEKEITYLTL